MQYRMQNNISYFISNAFYNNELKNDTITENKINNDIPYFF